MKGLKITYGHYEQVPLQKLLKEEEASDFDWDTEFEAILKDQKDEMKNLPIPYFMMTKDDNLFAGNKKDGFQKSSSEDELLKYMPLSVQNDMRGVEN